MAGSSPIIAGTRFVLKHHFVGMPKNEDFDFVEDKLPPLEDGHILIDALFLSVDPYMRPYVMNLKPPFTMIGTGVYNVKESKDSNFPEGATIVANVGWVKTGVVNSREIKDELRLIPDAMIKGISKSLLLGACGMPGNTAYFGLLELCQPKAGETVVVNGAAGAVGSLVGQIAKIKGCKVIGFAGSDQKCEWLTKELGFDKAYNYKTTDVDKVLKEGAPNGVDCFFDNVGGLDATKVINNHMNTFGRISGCGAISGYNATEPVLVPSTQGAMVFKQLRYEGFIVRRWLPRWFEGIQQMAQWIAQGKVKAEETVVEGFEKMPEAFNGLFTGANTGKMVVKI